MLSSSHKLSEYGEWISFINIWIHDYFIFSQGDHQIKKGLCILSIESFEWIPFHLPWYIQSCQEFSGPWHSRTWILLPVYRKSINYSTAVVYCDIFVNLTYFHIFLMQCMSQCLCQIVIIVCIAVNTCIWGIIAQTLHWS